MIKTLFWALFTILLLDGIIYLSICYYASSWNILILSKDERFIASIIIMIANIAWMAAGIGISLAKARTKQ